jgi:hypothetical protein
VSYPRVFSISNEAEFQQWLAAVLEVERELLRNQTAPGELDKYANLEAIENSGEATRE